MGSKIMYITLQAHRSMSGLTITRLAVAGVETTRATQIGFYKIKLITRVLWPIRRKPLTLRVFCIHRKGV